MAISVLVHISNEEPILGEVENLPTPGDTVLIVSNPRKRDGRDVTFLEANVTTVIWPWEQVSFVEVMPSGEEEEIIGFVRE
jgi:hypothetical protein